ncbi:MAG: cation transporter [Gemmatimonadaceae bacterium]
MDRMTMKIDGMSCGHCVAAVDKALQKLDGVKVEGVAIGKATVSYDPSKVSEDAIADAVADEGYAVVETTR